MPTKLDSEQKNIYDLLRGDEADFLIPDYQRPYAWEEEECTTLWDDIYSFAFPDDTYEKFDKNNDKYFLGTMVIFRNDTNNKLEVIDGQQRLTTLVLLLRAFFEAFGDSMQDEISQKTKSNIAECLWKTDEFGRPVVSHELKIASEVATDEDKDDFTRIMRNGKISHEKKSRYARNYHFFQDKIQKFKDDCPSFFPYLPMRILKNCILLPLATGTQNTALRIFSTLNDRGKPLSDSDIFKAQLYKEFFAAGKKDWFISQWRELESICEKIFKMRRGAGNSIDEIFIRYMYYRRAQEHIRRSGVEDVRYFYNKYGMLRLDEAEKTFTNLILLAHFWQDITFQNHERFSDRVLKRLFVLKHAPNNIWTYLVSVYFMHNKNSENNLDEEKFFIFLRKITAFILAETILLPGRASIQVPILNEMVNMIDGKEVTFDAYRFDTDELRTTLYKFEFIPNKKITRPMMMWYAFHNDRQELLSPFETFTAEHIYPRSRKGTLRNAQNFESLGNKSILEDTINIRASDYRFADKRKYYLESRIFELRELAQTKQDFTEQDIKDRNKQIIEDFLHFVIDNDLANN